MYSIDWEISTGLYDISCKCSDIKALWWIGMFAAPFLTSCILQGKSGSYTSFIQHKCRFRECLLVLCAVTALSRLNVTGIVQNSGKLF